MTPVYSAVMMSLQRYYGAVSFTSVSLTAQVQPPLMCNPATIEKTNSDQQLRQGFALKWSAK